MKDRAMLELIQPVTERLNRKYAAIGILEQWGASIRLFRAALSLPDYDWTQVLVLFYYFSHRHPFVVLILLWKSSTNE